MDAAVIKSLIGLLVPIVSMLTVVALVVVVMEYRHRNGRQLHETIARLGEKGLPVPPELFVVQTAPKSRLFWPCTLIGFGVGLVIYFVAQGTNEWGIGAIPLATGLAQLLAWKLEPNQPS